MRRIHKMSIIFLFLFTVGTVLAQDSDINGPRLTVDSIRYDFGEISEGDVVEHVFVFTNTGDDTLEIANVYTG